MMNNLNSKKILAFLVTILVLFTSCTEVNDTISIESLLNDMVNRDAVARYPKTNFRLKQQSSYNRASTNPDDVKGWFENHDYNSSEKDHNFIRIEETNGQKEWVIMEHEGAGTIVRSWMPFNKPDEPNSNALIKIYLDNSEKPVLEGNMLGLFNGTGLIPYPYAHKSLRSAVSFFPIPYAKSCKITVTERPFFFQFTYREYPKGTKVKTFNIEDFNTAKGLTEEVGKKLLSFENMVSGEKQSLSAKLDSKNKKSIVLPKGALVVKSLALKLGSYNDSSVTRSVILKMKFDGKETVWCPIGDFFGTGIGLHPYQGWYRTVDEDGTLSCRWVMPYKESGEITIENLGETPVDFELNVFTDKWEWDEQTMYFHAGWRNQYPVSTRPFSDWNYISLKGRGVYVGDALTVYNPVEKWWGEGDEKIWVDGESFPSIFGTGTEDYYAYSWGGRSTDFYEHPFHAQPRAYIYNKLHRKTTNEKNTIGYSTETRTRALDVMPFSTSLKLDMEVWSWTECDMAYTVGVYWYGDIGTESNHIPVPDSLTLPCFKKD